MEESRLFVDILPSRDDNGNADAAASAADNDDSGTGNRYSYLYYVQILAPGTRNHSVKTLRMRAYRCYPRYVHLSCCDSNEQNLESLYLHNHMSFWQGTLVVI